MTEQKDADLLTKWQSQNSNRQNFLPTRDLLKRMWEQKKDVDIVTTLAHPRFGSIFGQHEQIEVSKNNKYLKTDLFLIQAVSLNS